VAQIQTISVHPRLAVIKIGSAVLAPDGELDRSRVARLASDVAGAVDTGTRVVIVTSGAVASGFRALGLTAKPRTIVEKQAAAAVGQPRLMAAWSDALATHAKASAQVLLTADDFDDRRRTLNARRTLEELLARGVVPIINENDSVSFDEIKLGDNDRLSALVVGLVRADALVILSSAGGVYEGGDASRVIPRLDDPLEALRHVQRETTSVGTGGMGTKLQAAAMASEAGAWVVIAPGAGAGVLARALKGEGVGTFIPASKRVRESRKRWIGHASRSRGTIVVDDGAKRALIERGASLLPKGVVAVGGAFPSEATVEVAGADGVPFARGLVAYDAGEVRAIMGRKSEEIEGVLGYCYREEVIHRNDLVLLRGGAA
jgi:glutamate 5-kinase